MFILLNLGMSAGGLFSPEFAGAPWTIAKVIDLLKHLPLPIVIIGTAGTASIIRVMRASLMDELGKQYVVTARAKGVAENHLLFRYPVRVAVNPIISTVGWILPEIVSGVDHHRARAVAAHHRTGALLGPAGGRHVPGRGDHPAARLAHHHRGRSFPTSCWWWWIRGSGSTERSEHEAPAGWPSIDP